MSMISELVDSNEKALQRATDLLECASAIGNKQMIWKLHMKLLQLTTEKHKEKEALLLSAVN